VQAKEIKDIFGLTHGVGWCAPQQGACRVTARIRAYAQRSISTNPCGNPA